MGLLASIVFVGFLLVAVFPSQSWLNQRREVAARSAEVRDLEAEQRTLERRISTLKTDAEVERLAREQYGLVRPGEEAYAMLPPPAPAIDLPETWPFVGAEDYLNR